MKNTKMTFRNDVLPILITNINTSNPYLNRSRKSFNQNYSKMKIKKIEKLNHRGFLVIEYLQTTNLCWFPINSSQNWYSAKLTNKFHIGQMTPPSAFSQFYLKMCHF